MRPGQDARITHLFKRGYSLDLVSEFGLLYGWTRSDAKAVLAAQGWALDWHGRLQVQFLRQDIPNTATTPSVAAADPELVLNAGIDHENGDIRRAAHAAERAIEKLRTLLMAQETLDAERAQDRLEASGLSGALGVVLGVEVPGQRANAS
jgi:hypothetical protein